MVAAHIHDLRAAAKVGMKTIYVKRPTEDSPEVRESIRAKNQDEDGGGGEVDVVVGSLEELAGLFADAKRDRLANST
jgi:methionine salvage enolase-phosphatase E1